MFPLINQIVSPLFSLFILVIGNGLFLTLVSVRLFHEGYGSMTAAFMMAAYHLGLIIAAFKAEKFICRVGHIRAFAALAALLSTVSVLHAFIFSIPAWLVLRSVSGFATAGLFVVIESWLLVLGGTNSRGRMLSLYMISLYAAQASGQFLLNLGDPKELTLFAIVGMITAFSIIPVAITKNGSPNIHEPSTLSLKDLLNKTRVGLVACLMAGVMLAIIYGLFPMYVMKLEGGNKDILPLMMASIIAGGMSLQYPLGRLSDHIDRRNVLLLSCFMIVILGLVIDTFFSPESFSTIILLFLFGGFSFTIYPVAISYACDALDEKDITAGTQTLLLAYSFGSIFGPLLASLFMKLAGTHGFFYCLITASLVLIGYLIRSKIRRSEVISELEFNVVPQTTPIISEIDPRGSTPEVEETESINF